MGRGEGTFSKGIERGERSRCTAREARNHASKGIAGGFVHEREGISRESDGVLDLEGRREREAKKKTRENGREKGSLISIFFTFLALWFP